MYKEFVKSVEYREAMESQLAYDFWFMNSHMANEWDDDFSWDKNCFPIEWGNGWLAKFYELCNQLITEVKSNFQFTQLKEKWGYANCYYDGGITPYGEELIHNFEEETKSICEICGSSEGLMRTDGWYKVMCEDCYKDL